MAGGIVEADVLSSDSKSSPTITPLGFRDLNPLRKTSHDGSLAHEKNTIHDGGEIEGRQGREGKFIELEDEFPENSLRAYLNLIGTTCICFVTMGYASSWGIFQAYYEETILKDSSPSAIALIGSIQSSLVFLPALIVGRLFDIGYFHSVFLPSSVLLVVATFLTGQCTQYWQFVLCQGLAIGIACGGMFGSRPPILAHWFKEKRGRALGYSGMGASVSSTLFPIAARNLIPQVGFPWTMRIFGFVLIVVVGICNLTLRRRLPPQTIKGGILHLASFKEIPYTMYCISTFFIYMGLYTVSIYVDVSATNLGSTRELALYFVAFANAGAFLGRCLSGILADRIGPVNTAIPFTLGVGMLTYAWPLTRSTASLVVVTVIYGFCSGAFAALFSAPAMNLGKEGDVGRRVGMCITITAFGSVIGPPLSGAINKKTGGFEAVGLFAGSMVIIGVGCMVVVRHLVLRKWTGKV